MIDLRVLMSYRKNYTQSKMKNQLQIFVNFVKF